MTHEDLLRLLVQSEFPSKYWAWCDRHPLRPGSLYEGLKEDVLAAFRGLGIEPKYDRRDRSYVIEPETIDSTLWEALFVKQRSGLEFMFSGTGPSGRVGSNLAVLAYDAKRLEDPAFSRSPFSGPPPYPKPSAASREELETILGEFVDLVHELKHALRSRVA